MTEAKFESGYIAPNAEISFINSPTDISTFFVDGMKGLAMQPHVTKISFFEQISDPLQQGVIFGRFVLNLALPNDQFFAIADLLKQMADDIRQNQTLSESIHGIGPANSE